MLIHYKYKFIPHKRKADAVRAVILLRVTIRGQKPFDVTTSLDCDLSLWDKQQMRALPGEINADAINNTIEQWAGVVRELFARYELIEKRIPTPEEARELFLDLIGRETKITAKLPKTPRNVNDAFEQFIDTIGTQNQWTNETNKKMRAIKNHLYKFNRGLTFQQINLDVMQNYLQHLTRKGYNNTTIRKNIAFVRWFLGWAYTQGYYEGNMHLVFKPRLKGTDGNSKEIIYLTKQELHAVETYNFTQQQQHLAHTRDVFVFCCYTGLRYSDVANLTTENIKDGYISIVTQKTSDGLRIELNQHAQAILDKYKGCTYKKGLALPVISNQKMNAQLKQVGKLVGLNEPTKQVYFQGNTRHEDVFPKWALLTTHCGRRTFVITALQLGIPCEVIMKWTGHSDFKAMKPYIKSVDELKQQEMQRFNSLD